MPAPAAQSLEKEDPNASRGAKGGIKRSRRARISRRPRELDRQRALGFRLGSPLFHSQPSVAGCFAVGLETIVYILDREARFVRDFLRINPEDIKDGYHLVDTTRETEEERRKKLLDKYLKYQFSSLLSRSDVGLAEALMRPDEPSVKRLPEAFACLLLVSHALERHNNAVEAQKKNIDLAPPVEETSRKSAMRTLTRANRHRSRFGTMRQARASTLKRPGAAPAAPAANSWLLVSEAVAPIVTEFLVNLQLRLQIKVTDALNKACEWVAGQPPPNLKRAGILAPVAKLPHYVDVVLLAGALADDASSFASDLLNSSRTPRISSTDRNSSSFDNVARRGSGNKVDGGHGILLIGNQPDYFLRTLTGMDGGEAPSMFRDDQKGRRSNRRGALPNMQEAREANMSAGGSGGLDVVATLLSKLTTRVVQWLEEVADRPSNAKYKQIGLIENYTFLHRTMAQRGLVCLNDFVAQCETRANSHAETYLNWSLNYEFPNLTKFWREVEDIVKERGMPAVMQSVPKAKYAKMKAEHPPEKVRNGLREVHSRLGKHCTAEEGFLRAQLWRRLIDKILTSWSRWEELASVCYQDESFHVTSQQIHRWLSEIHQS
uniref:Exocyst complex component Sec3 C-terminal domain-containing protein n=1 Tax=Pinguiococcus pyrenoidosus TaxID=172671 RepID=A0A7R9UH43_9STRA